MTEKLDPLATHIPEGMTEEEAAAEEERLKRLQFELDMFQESTGIGDRAAKISKLDE